MQLLGGQDGKAVAQVKPHLMAENALRAGAGTVTAQDTGLADVTDEIKILLHAQILAARWAASKQGRDGAPRLRL